MKKITFLMILLTASFGFSQDLLLGFEDAESGGLNGGPFGNANALQVNLVTDAGTNGTKVAEFIANSSGEIWQGINMNLTSNVDLTSTQTMTIDVKSATPITFLAKVNGGVSGAPEAAAAVTHNGDGTWQTLSFTFNTALDGKAAMANGVYTAFVIHAYWSPGATVFGDVTADERTFYVDNIKGPLSMAETCSDGIMNQDETGIDCGGTVCSECLVDPSGPAPSPSTPDAEVLSIYGDTGGFTNVWTPDYSFGSTQGEVDFGSGSVNNAIKMDFSNEGYGQGTNAPVDISAYDWVHFDYYAPTSTPGVNGHEVKFILIGNGEGEKDYVFKTDGSGDAMLMFDAWQSIDIPLSHFTALGLTKPNYLQYKLGTTSDLNTTIVYFDNIYFSVNQGTLGTDDFSKTSFRTYPNPTQDSWTIETQDVRIASITVFDVLGKSVMTMEPNKDRAVIDGSSLKSGLYFAKVETAAGVSSVKLIKK